jgi:hypothetical protein
LYLSLPSKGKFYPEGAIEMTENGEFPVYPMTAIDEITSKTPDALFNGQAVVSIIKSCIPGIKDPWQMPSVDIDASLIAIRAATNGTDLEVESKCPKCEEEAKYGVNLIGLLGKMSVGNYDNLLNSGELKIKLKPMNYTDINQGNLAQFEMQRDISSIESIVDQDERNEKSRTTMLKISKMNIDMMMNSIEFIMIPTDEQVIDKAFIGEFLENCDRNVHELLRNSITSLRENTIIKPQQIKCIHCTYDYDQPLILNVTDFFA